MVLVVKVRVRGSKLVVARLSSEWGAIMPVDSLFSSLESDVV